MTAALLALAMLAAPAQADDWRDIVAGPESVWSINGKAGTQTVRGAKSVVAIVRRTTNDGKAQSYLAAVPVAHCDAPRGDLTLQPLDAQAGPISGVWERSSAAAAARLAVALCNESRRGRT